MTAPQPATRQHWPALDGWRGFSIWFAISVHAGYFTAGGVLSLDTFFVLSGFLITGILLREWNRTERIALANFWARRACRLLPALFVVLGAVLVYAAFLAPSIGLDTVRADVISSLFYVVNWHFIASGQSYFGAFTTPSPVLHLWSLAVEEQFYLFWPLIVLAVLWVARRRSSPRGAIIAVGVVALLGSIASAMWMVALYQPGGDPSRVYYGTDTRAQAMLMGAVLAVIVMIHGPLRSRLGRALLAIAAPLCLAVVVVPWFLTDQTAVHDFFYGRYGLFGYSVATSVVLWRLVQPAPGVLGWGLALAPMRWVGGISYEMYLWHWPTYLVVTPARTGMSGLTLLAVRLGVVVLLSWGTHVLVDEPIRRGARLHSPRFARVATVGVVIALSVGVFAATVGAEPALSGNIGQVADRGGPPVVSKRAATVPLKVLVVGDSQAATLAQGVHADPGVYGVSAQPGMVVWNRAILGCSIISAPTFLIDGNRVANKCGGAGFWQREWAADIATFRPDAVVVMAGAWDVFDVVLPSGGTLRPGDPAWSAVYDRDVSKLFETLGAQGAEVVAVKPPCFGESQLVGTDPQIPSRMDPAIRNAIIDAWHRAALAHGTRLLDLDSVLCPKGVSDPAVRPDGAHFDGAGADRVAPVVATAVRRAAAAAAAPAATPGAGGG